MNLSLKIVGGLVALILVTLIGLTFVDVNNFKPEIEAAVYEQTGRKLTLEGPIRIGLSLSPTIVAEDVRFGNVAWGSQPEMMSAGELTIGLSIVNAFIGEVEVANVSARDVSLFLESGEKGTVNWDIAAAGDGSVERADADPFVVPSLDLRDVSVTYNVGRTGQAIRAELEHIEIQNSFAGLGIELEGDLEGQRLLIAGGLEGSPADFVVSDLMVRFGDMRFNGDLSAKRPKPESPYTVVSHIRGGRVQVTELVETLLADPEEVDDEADKLDLSFLGLVDGDVTLEIERVDFRRVAFKQIVARLKSTGRSGHADLSALYEGKRVALALDLKGGQVPAVTISAEMEELDVGSLASNAGFSDDIVATAKGSVDLKTEGQTLADMMTALSGQMNGEVLLDRIDLTFLDDGVEDEEAGAVEAGDPEVAVTETDDAFVFDNEPLPLNMIDGFSGALTLTAEEVRYRDLLVTQVQVPVTFEGSNVSTEFTALYKDQLVQFTNQVVLGELPRFEFDIAADDFDLGELLKETGATDLISVRADFAMHGTATGHSPRALASSFTGAVNLVAGEGEIASGVLELIATDLTFALVPKGDEGGIAKLSCIVTGLAFENGVGQMQSFALVTKRMRTGGKGTIDLHDEKLDLIFVPKPNDTSLLSLSTPIRVRGTLSNPSVSPDTGALLVDVATAVGAGLFTGGLGAILPLLSVQNFDAEDAGACLSMLGTGEGTGERGGIVGTVGAGADLVKDGATGVVEGIGDVLTSPFK
ncbi:MAG: AsmA family protein [Parvibaculum sp.]